MLQQEYLLLQGLPLNAVSVLGVQFVLAPFVLLNQHADIALEFYYFEPQSVGLSRIVVALDQYLVDFEPILLVFAL